jgi:hypothetical protein
MADRIFDRTGRQSDTHDIIRVQGNTSTVFRDMSDEEVFQLREVCNYIIYGHGIPECRKPTGDS